MSDIIKQSEFVTSQLCDIASVQTGPFGSQLHQRDYVNIGTPIITVEHLGDNKIIHENLPCVSDKDRDRLSKYQLLEGDIVFSRVGSVDRCAYVKKEEAGWLFSGRCLRIRSNPQLVSSRYLSFYFGHPSFKTYIRQIAVGATMPSLNTSLMGELEIPLPPLPTQKKIASILSSLDDKIEINIRMNKVLEEIARALFHRWFVEFEFPDEKGRPYKSSGGKMVESEMGFVPEGWKVHKLDEISKDIVCGKTPSTKVLEYYGNSIPFITIPDMHNQVYITSTERHLSIIGANSQIKKTLPKNSICVSCIATPGLVSLTSVKSQTNQQINSIICKDEISPYFVYLSMLNLSLLIDNLGSGGSTTSNLNKTQFSKIKIIVPSEDIMKKFDKMLSPIFNKIETMQIESQKIMKIRDSLLPKLMSGELM